MNTFWLYSGLGIAFVIALDALLAIRRGNPLEAEREHSMIWPIGMAQKVHIRLLWKSPTKPKATQQSTTTLIHGMLNDNLPRHLKTDHLPQSFEIRQGEWTQLTYSITPDTRGEHLFPSVSLRIRSPLALWFFQDTVTTPTAVRVYPNFARITQYALLATDNRLAQMGILRRRRRGQGLDFEQLREYRRDDSIRSIDWKATARHQKPIVREYQDERDQQIVFLLDCGQRMRSKDNDLSHFDHTLNALLLLAYVAIRQGDAVGLSTFAQQTSRYLAPKKSASAIQNLLNSTYDLQPSALTPDYLKAATDLNVHLRKRSMIVILTNLRDEDDSSLLSALHLLQKRHLVLLVSLRETGLDQLLQQRASDFDTALGYASATEYKQSRQRQFQRFKAHGIHLLESSPKTLPTDLVNKYWDLKRSGIL